ncbi:MAG: isochorismatase hydrolase [Anaerocolumna sp.]|jgi:nicotinamidase-related amidase|nr:isochorismatase hydrolase [Anaerocolumna sp.]
MNKKALLIIDVQKAIMDEKPHNSELLINTINDLSNACREKNIEVIYVRHDGVDDELAMGSEGWEIYHDIKPHKGEKIFEKRYNSAFKNTGLKEYLQSNSITTLILAGLQTEYCIDASIKSAFDSDFQIIIPQNGFSTIDQETMSAQAINDFYFGIWNNRFGKIKNSFDIIKEL